ncbi:unnamed protein product [Owenia fusiformis]|uniref:WH1 domain-containing protein n=1 Tax=Owenia fusiformis TaxID=6347 RepID=A0A8S4PCS9_OWEFU|nr:unnamed protein product [Owenia fusiformis]
MTDGNMKNADDYLVRVKAQVMQRVNDMGYWVPYDKRSELCIVGLRKVLVPLGDEMRTEYLIYGQRISDHESILNCSLKKDVEYTNANPTFLHWTTEKKKFGLTFQSPADAKAFDKEIKKAIKDLLAGPHNAAEAGEDDVFMQLNLPCRKGSSSQSASTASTTTSSPTPQSPGFSPAFADPFAQTFTNSHNRDHLHRVVYWSSPNSKHSSPGSDKSGGSSKSNEEVWKLRSDKTTNSGKGTGVGSTGGVVGSTDNAPDDSYVQFEHNRPSTHDYSYPMCTLDPASNKHVSGKRDSVGSIKKNNLECTTSQPPLPMKNKHKKRDKMDSKNRLLERSRCVYCHEVFVHDENPRGNCEDAPDRVANCIEKVSCLSCAHCMLYHCMSDPDGDYGHLCVCDSSDENNSKKWTVLTVLSFFVPCLCCYGPLTACHRCGVACGCCGGRHKAV